MFVRSRGLATAICGICAMWCGAALGASPVVVYQENFEAGVVPKAANWDFSIIDNVGASLDIATDPAGGKGIRGAIPIPAGSGFLPIRGGVQVPPNTSEIFIEFDARMPKAKHGIKFVKVFGGRDSSGGYANTTFGLDYTGVDYGSMYCVSYGDGDGSIGNDTTSIIKFTGEDPGWVGRAFGKTADVYTGGRAFSSADWGTGWHRFRLSVKFNTGTTASDEKADGAFYVEIDGKLYVDAKGMFNRHYSNKPIDHVEFFGWTQTGNTAFELWYDNITVSTGGFVSGPKLSRPSSFVSLPPPPATTAEHVVSPPLPPEALTVKVN